MISSISERTWPLVGPINHVPVYLLWPRREIHLLLPTKSDREMRTTAEEVVKK